MPVAECRIDKLAHDRVPIWLVMGIPQEFAPQLWVLAPEFPVRRADAAQIVREWAAKYPGAKAYLSKEIVRPNELTLQLGELPADGGPARMGSWAGFIDLVPDQNWSHQCLYLFIDEDKAIRETQADWYPTTFRTAFAPLG